jgi:hypothetical protein
MIKFLRNLRRRALEEGGLGRYLAYATGEILLVVIGILIALQINTWNDARKDRQKELVYLANIRADLVANIAEMDRTLEVRTARIAAARRILDHFNGKPIEDASAFNADGIGIYSWQRFYLGDNGYQELVNSGNFALLRNHAIKDQLLDIDALYRKMKGEEDHYRFDTETTLYAPLHQTMDTEAMVADFEYRVSGGKSGRKGAVDAATFAPFLRNQTLKNGFVMTIIGYNTMNAQMRELRQRCETLVEAIDAEVRRG